MHFQRYLNAYVIDFLLSCGFIGAHDSEESEFLINGTFLSNRLTLEFTIPKFTFPLLNVKLALLPHKKCSPKFKSCDRFLTTMGSISIVDIIGTCL